MSILQLTKLLGHLTPTIQAALPARLNIRFLQQKQIQTLKEKDFYLVNTTLNDNSKKELLWWIKNLEKFFQYGFSSQTGFTSCTPDGCLIDCLVCSSLWKINKWHINELEVRAVNRKSENGYTVRKDLGNINFKTAFDYFGVPTSSLNKVADLENCHKGLI